ncbi:hypothetical protein NM208_g3286 [Fusarium decemcellulare]|uniref:Uncharacterized protein n=1 Tax=Fusarium decemcellulare TaxID=57161 RepID=A0ACC1SQ55_9HYPO|nr:hypothetical protein NM208_g3286 [Fusarium decemcellulare]
MATTITGERLDYLFNHLFLPPKLPGDDDSSASNDAFLINFVHGVLHQFLAESCPEYHAAIRVCISMMERMKTSRNALGHLAETGARGTLQKLSPKAPVALFHIVAQNAGLLIRRLDDSVCFETFELSPTNTSAMTTRGRLIRHFPATATELSLADFENNHFQSAFVNTIVTMSHQALSDTQTKVKKAKQTHDEERETIHPRIVTELLTSILQGAGKAVTVTGLSKNTREEISWRSSKLPWRRSPLWLLIRVGLQLTMTRLAVDSVDAYKPFMAFLMAQVLKCANGQLVSSDVLHTMRTKVAGRLCKLENPRSGKWLDHVQQTVAQTSECLTQRWEGICKVSEKPLALDAVSKLDFGDSTHLSLTAVDHFIACISRRDKENRSTYFRPTAYISFWDEDDLPIVNQDDKRENTPPHLAAIEWWVATNLDRWIKKHVHEERSCQMLKSLLQSYHAAASKWYPKSPENASRMHLVIAELWVALDRAAVHVVPMLKLYHPEVYSEGWQALLLGSKDDMARLYRVEAYLSKRRVEAMREKRPSVFRSYGEALSFPVQYFAQSSSHQEMKSQIDRDASEQRKAKIAEFRRLKEEYENLMAEHNEISCDETSLCEDGVTSREHDPKCHRCSLLERAKGLTIRVHEWPLPSNGLEAQAVVFELDAPGVFTQWRDATLYLIDDVLKGEASRHGHPVSSYALRDYQGLSRYLKSRHHRVHLLSEVKPHVVTHRREKPVGHSTETDVCLNNGLIYKYFDGSRKEFLAEYRLSVCLSDLCTFELPERAKALESFLKRSWRQPNGQCPNQVIASQFNCPDHMSLGEYKALAALPTGLGLQWINVLTQLAMPSIDFNKTETAIFLLQMSLQAGPPYPPKGARYTHTQLCEQSFGHEMLAQLTQAVSRVQENWESHIALCSFTFLTARLLSLAAEELSQPLLDLLRRCREIAYGWLMKLMEKVQETSNDAQRKEFTETGVKIALLCVDTFNVDDRFIPRILSHPYQASVLVETSIIIHNQSTLWRTGDNLYDAMLERCKYTLYRSRPVLVREIINNRNNCLDLAIKRRWPAFVPDNKWFLVWKTRYWFETTCARMKVSLNILTGELLVNGAPLSRLPRDYETHSTYGKLFGSLVLDVMPSTVPGMRFCASKLFQGRTIHFGKQDAAPGKSGPDLLVQLESDGSSLDLIPSRALIELLPHSFVNDYIHWYHNDSGAIEFRPLSSPWDESPYNWRLTRHGTHWRLSKHEKMLVSGPSNAFAKDETILLSPSSLSGKTLAAMLSPLDAPLSLHMLYSAAAKVLEIRVPGLQLEFLLKYGESSIRCRQFRDMEIDPNQSVGALVGLTSKLVLRSVHDHQARVVIIPEGEVRYHKTTSERLHNHIEVSVTYGTARRVQAYRIDPPLRRLMANDKLESKLFLAYLHALTSFCLPDPFIGRRGTEQALAILGSAPVRAPCALSQVAHDRLALIANLTPGRSFYPTYKTSMQQVAWSPELSFLTQDDRFYKVVHEILARCQEVDFLYPRNDVVQAWPAHATMELISRAILRASRQQVSGFGAEEFTTQYDVLYATRDRGQQSDRSVRAREMAFRIYNNQQYLCRSVSRALGVHLYSLIRTAETINTRTLPFENRIGYDASWLQGPAEFLSSNWCQLHYAFQKNRNWKSKFSLMIWIATVAYSPEYDTQVTQALMMMALCPSVSETPLPAPIVDLLVLGYDFRGGNVESIGRSAAIPFEQSREAKMAPLKKEHIKTTIARRKSTYGTNKNRAVTSFRNQLQEQWPCEYPVRPEGKEVTNWINVPKGMAEVRPKWAAWYKNHQFKTYLDAVVSRLKEIEVTTTDFEQIAGTPDFKPAIHAQGFVSIDDIFTRNPPSFNRPPTPMPSGLLRRTTSSVDTSKKLTDVLDHLDNEAGFGYEHRYLQELRESLVSLQSHSESELDEDRASACAALFQQHLEQCELRVRLIYDSLSQAIKSSPTSVPQGSESIHSSLSHAGLLPRISPQLFLQQLKQTHWSRLSDPWREAIVKYGVAITALQQAKRLIRFQNNHVDLLRELENTGHLAWNPHDYPEWLLLECESEIMIRDVQHQIASHMIQPPNNDNAVMQLNMGEGKSTVIGSHRGDSSWGRFKTGSDHRGQAAGEADASDAVVKVGWPAGPSSISAAFLKGHQDGWHSSGCDSSIDGRVHGRKGGHGSAAEIMMGTRQFFDKSSRDVVDESDENFSVKFELIYTLGQQRSIEHSPDRWNVIQEILGLVGKFCAEAKDEFSQSIEFDDRHSERFPRIRFLRPDAEEAILDRVADAICEIGMTGFPINRQTPKIREAVRRYITLWALRPKMIKAVEKSLFWTGTTISYILLLRGLFAGGILVFALGQKRWRVNYGTDSNRETKTKLAVPFRAKDNPTPRSEFSHPDVVITLTCLSYYYGGLDDEALFDALGLLTRSDNAKLEYQEWVATAPTLPHSFRYLEGVNLRDRIQCISQVFPHLRFSKAAIDYYLCRMVFAKESKEFPHKLSASGWDLGKKKSNPTTGFSGTNDSRYLLPLGMKQLDLAEQKHTNALVLEYLLRPENGIVLMPDDTKGSSFDSEALLKMVTEMSTNTRVILDVGAQVIDLTNLEFAKEWLSRYKDDENTQAVICFSELDEIIVVDRSGKVEELQTSPFADQLDQCLVFLDEAHTRGTDLKLPANYRALVTLGAGLTKDRLVQACMRMRKLGKGQTVVFCIPREIEQKILREYKQSSASSGITVSDVICWVINETCLDLRRAMPLWLNQGLRFYEQERIWRESYEANKSKWAEKFKEDEAQSLEDRYRPRQTSSGLPILLDKVESQIGAEFQRRCDEFGLTELRTTSLQEEQERELSPETQQERQVEKPPIVEPGAHNIHDRLRQFVKDGHFPGECDAFKPAFRALDQTSAASHFDVAEFPSKIWVTHDFATTVKAKFGPKNCSDSFQRPVQWILTSNAGTGNMCLVIISPYEAQLLLQLIEKSEHVTLHTYAPRINLGFQPLDHLKLYTVPQRETKIEIPLDLSIQLNLFAGQLYLSSFDEYTAVCDALGLAWGPVDDSVTIGPDGFIPPGNLTGTIVNRSGFTKSPVRFLKVLMAKIRQECELIEKTHVGKILEGIRLLEDDF